jgi:hypothetical protein
LEDKVFVKENQNVLVQLGKKYFIFGLGIDSILINYLDTHVLKLTLYLLPMYFHNVSTWRTNGWFSVVGPFSTH